MDNQNVLAKVKEWLVKWGFSFSEPEEGQLKLMLVSKQAAAVILISVKTDWIDLISVVFPVPEGSEEQLQKFYLELLTSKAMLASGLAYGVSDNLVVIRGQIPVVRDEQALQMSLLKKIIEFRHFYDKTFSELVDSISLLGLRFS